MNESFEIIPVTVDMLDGMEHIAKTCFTVPWSRTSLSEDISAPYSCWLAAAAESVPCGFLGAHVLGGEGEIVNIAVLPEYRRNGLARAMMNRFFELYPELTQVFLEVRESNAPARALYESLGFKAYGVRKKYYEKPVEDAILMICASGER